MSLNSRQWRAEVRRHFEAWENVFTVGPESEFFRESDRMPDFDFKTDDFCPTTAWWLSELCRTSYTPDREEIRRGRLTTSLRREDFLEARSPFTELHSVHKTVNHAAIYRRQDERGGTILCFRGTQRVRQWVMNLVVRPHRWRRFRLPDEPSDGRLHSGFYVFFKRIWPLLSPALDSMPRPWIFTGHSLGGALASIASVVAKPDLLCTFGAPKVGNTSFSGLLKEVPTWRVVNHADLVPHLPFVDPRVGKHEWVHAGPSVYLNEDGSLERDKEAPGDEAELSYFADSFSSRDFSPPLWLTDHRIGGYCRKLRELSAGMMP